MHLIIETEDITNILKPGQTLTEVQYRRVIEQCLDAFNDTGSINDETLHLAVESVLQQDNVKGSVNEEQVKKSEPQELPLRWLVLTHVNTRYDRGGEPFRNPTTRKPVLQMKQGDEWVDIPTERVRIEE